MTKSSKKQLRAFWLQVHKWIGLARKMRRWHDGTDMGIAWQVVIFLGGIIPALLSVTGIIIWWRARQRRRANGRLAPAAA